MTRKTVVLLDDREGRELAKNSCEEGRLRFAEFEALVKAQLGFATNATRHQLYAAFDDILDRIRIEK